MRGARPGILPVLLLVACNGSTGVESKGDTAELGRRLFYDARLSGNGTQSCRSCHQQAKAFTDGLATAVGSTGAVHPRNTPSLANAALNLSFNWANPELLTLEAQHIRPIIGTVPIVEMGVNDGNRETVLQRFRGDADYAARFAAAFPNEADPVTLDNIVAAIASFSRVLISDRSPFDRFQAGETTALSAGAQRGFALFGSDRLECNACHGGFNFSDSTRGPGGDTPQFHNTGLYNIAASPADGAGNNYPPGNQGLYDFTANAADKGRFKAPTLRNLLLTAPYNHDGSVATLSDVIDNYARGGRLVTTPPERAGDGKNNANKDGEIHGFTLTADEKADLLAFLDSLTDTEFTTDPLLADPFKGTSP